MSLPPGSRLGQYEVIAPLGSGGMGDVYRARDSRLGRDVAIKTLPDRFLHDAERLQRFEREAQILATLNHPNLATIYQLERHADTTFLILELIEGPTLADRLAAGALPLDEALDIARQMAEGLEAAHEKGIVHRDLKPANIKVTTDGRVKILDFGLAKIFEPADMAADVSHSPTLTNLNTGVGVILGTAAYMSPEQARGRSVDRRSDMWSFGCVLYEMLAGRQAFANEETVSDTLATILKGDVDWTALPVSTPPRILLLLQRCLRKDPRRRLGDASAARLELEEASGEAHPEGAPAAPMSFARRYGMPLVAITALAVGAAGLAAWAFGRPPAEARVVRFHVLADDGTDIQNGQPLSPDGRTLAFVAGPAGKRQIWVRSLDSTASRPLDGTDGALRVVWSHDSEHLAFFADSQLKRVPAAGGAVRVMASESGRDVAWGPNGVVLIGGQGRGLHRVSENGGAVTPVTMLADGELTHDYPQFLPDGRHFLYLARRGNAPEDWSAYVGSLESTERVALPDIHSGVRYSASGHLVYKDQSGTLMVLPFDAERREVTGVVFAAAEATTAGPAVSFSISANGTLAYVSPDVSSESRPTWFNRAGQPLGSALPAGEYRSMDLSPDGQLLAFDRGTPGDVYTLDIAQGGQASRLTTDPAADGVPVWGPDSRRLVFLSSRNPAGNTAPSNLYSGNLWSIAYGTLGQEVELLATNRGKAPTDWSRSGYIVYVEDDDLWALPMKPAGATPVQITRTPFAETNAQVSPDGRWIAYNTLEIGSRNEVFIQPFPQGGDRKQVSLRGGWLPRWSPDSRELFFFELEPETVLMSVSVSGNGPALTAIPPTRLFPARLPTIPGYQTFRVAPGSRSYDVAPDGRFLINLIAAEQAAPITVIYNWTTLLKQP